MQRWKFLSALSVLMIVVFLSCQKTDRQNENKYPIEVMWVRQSVEYQAICLQTYRTAWNSVKSQAALLEENWAVVLDVDETVLDNSRYQEILYEQNKEFPYYWDEWVLREECPPVPGAKAFIDSVRSLGDNAHVVYITNRNTPLENATRENLKKAGLWQEGDVLLCQISREDTKEIRRNEVINGSGRCAGQGRRIIIALLGDQLADVTAYPQKTPAEKYRNYFRDSEKWGTKYFILPNPMYGYWAGGYKR